MCQTAHRFGTLEVSKEVSMIALSDISLPRMLQENRPMSSSVLLISHFRFQGMICELPTMVGAEDPVLPRTMLH